MFPAGTKNATFTPLYPDEINEIGIVIKA